MPEPKSAKKTTLELVERLDKDMTYDDIMCELYAIRGDRSCRVASTLNRLPENSPRGASCSVLTIMHAHERLAQKDGLTRLQGKRLHAV